MVTLIGKGVCSAVAIGTIHFYRRSRREIEKKNIENPSVELAKFKRSIKSAEKEIDELYDTAYEKVGENEAEIFKIHRMILEDKDYTEAVEGIIADERVNCEYAIFETCEKFQKIFLSMDDEYMRGRAADIKDVSERLLNILGGGSHSEISGDRVILAADDLAPSETVRLDKDKIIEIEVDAEEHHKHRYDHLGIETVIALDAVVEHCEAACARRRKGVDYAVKQRHSAEGEHDYLNESHHAIDAVKYPCRDAEL